MNIRLGYVFHAHIYCLTSAKKKKNVSIIGGSKVVVRFFFIVLYSPLQLGKNYGNNLVVKCKLLSLFIITWEHRSEGGEGALAWS